VAYSDEARRQIGSDEIPAMSVVPVLIRCREWREYIRFPIPTMLRKMPEITGHSVLSEFWEALQPHLKRGQVLLLVDGLDEIHSDADRATFVEHLETFLSEFKQIRLVVTSREAGFSLVAPGLARFCQRFRIAPLDVGDVRALCGHWHRLIAGDTPESEREARDLSSQIEINTALRRLAENPLLLTMILVVKHGAGRLPPDRVTLYGRAVEVLLDTWNIKGHAPLNSKEAVPQLAYVAFELTRAGKQTATEKELLHLLEYARERVPQIRLYAQDTPSDFLRRVELRSSLLVEGGSVSEGGRTVPFYQFRHLTFQEFLTAVAVVDGHYVEYSTTHSLLTPLQPFLTNPEWKEVIPMAAVLAGKRAEPLLAALVKSWS
jgi:predicted NACHT family NTPase